jgi:hypothetical protein
MNRRVRAGRRRAQPYWVAGYGSRVIFRWAGLIVAWVLVLGVLGAVHLGLLAFLPTAGLIWYAVHSDRLGRPQPPQPWTSLLPYQQTYQSYQPPFLFDAAAGWVFYAPPGWPQPPAGWSPPPGWQPDASWPPAPPGWQFWMQVPPAPEAAGERNPSTIPQNVKIAVSARDQGRCVRCGSREELDHDHKLPWPDGGSNAAHSIQPLCGRCNRIKGADDIAAW